MSTDSTTRVALVTGGSRGLGRETVLRLAEDGVDILFTFHSREDAAAEVVDRVRALGRRALALRADLTGTRSIDALVEEVRSTLEEWGHPRLDHLILNAGIDAHMPFEQVTEKDLDAQFETNYKSAFFLVQQLLPVLADGGRIVTLGTGATRFVVPNLPAYAPLKAALESLTTYLAKVLGPRGITANVVAPGVIETDFTADALRTNPGMGDYLAANTALGRIGRPTDIGGVVRFLCSADAGWITGQRLEASGGMFL